MNYIIFGGTGFIGTHLANLIYERECNSNIWNLDIVDPSKLDAMTDEEEIRQYTTIKQWKSPVVDGGKRKARYAFCDVRQPIVKLPFTPTEDDIVFNLAAVHRTPGHPDLAYFETNIRGAENICAFCDKWNIRNVVFTSSIAPYGAAEQQKTEDSLPTPNTPYGISKLVAEKIHLAWQNGGSHSHDAVPIGIGGRRLTILRPGVVFGKGENGNFTRLYWSVRKHSFAYPGRKDTIKACIYVKELVRFIMWNVEERHSPCEIYNCTFEPAYSIESIVKRIKSITGLKQSVPYIPNCVIMPMAAFAQLVGSPMGICKARVKKLQISTNISGKKLADSGYKFKWTFDEAIKDWLNDNNGRYLK